MPILNVHSMAKQYTYKKIQAMRDSMIEEMKASLPAGITIEHLKLVEMRIQTAIMAGLFDDDLKK